MDRGFVHLNARANGTPHALSLGMTKTIAPADATPTLAQRRTVWRANAPHSALMRLGASAPSPGSLAMAIDTFSRESDLKATLEDLEAVLDWMRSRPA